MQCWEYIIGSMEKQSQNCQKTPSFLQKTYNILSMAEYADICAWNPEGTLFQILDEEKFICQILPRHFKHNKLNSFIRQLNIYGFRKVRKSVSQKTFKHEFFLRDDRSRINLIRRRVKARKPQSDTRESLHPNDNNSNKQCSKTATSVDKIFNMDMNKDAESIVVEDEASDKKQAPENSHEDWQQLFL